MIFETLDILWRSALIMVPLAMAVSVLCAVIPCRPTTRHLLWLLLLGLLVLAPVLAVLNPAPEWRAWIGARLAVPNTNVADQAAHRSADLAIQRNRQAPASPHTNPTATTLRSVVKTTPPAVEAYRLPVVDVPHLIARNQSSPNTASSLNERKPAPLASKSGAAPIDADESEQRTATMSWREPAAMLIETMPFPGLSYLPSPANIIPELVLIPDLLPSLDLPALPEDSSTSAVASAAPADTDRAAPPTSAGTARSRLEPWIAQLVLIRDAVLGLPTVPAPIWGGGIALLIVLLGIRVTTSARLIGRGIAAPDDVVEMVNSVAKRLELRRAPRTLMVDGRVSPMIWVGRSATLVFPARLWAQLDDHGREAVLVHELAHLRRRDHWVCWVELLIGCLYWWHPLVWWLRRRIREEADLCCDVWVTTLLPTARRAYAEALLETRRYTSELPAPVPSIGLGASTGRMNRFARRITMVMTEQGTPRMSRRGLALGWTLGLAGLIAVPVLACPPESNERAKAKAAEKEAKVLLELKAAKARGQARADRDKARAARDKARGQRKATPHRLRTPATAPAAPGQPTAPAPASPFDMNDETTFEMFMRSRQDTSDMSCEERVEMLERQIDELQRMLERLMNDGQVPHASFPSPQANLLNTVNQQQSLRQALLNQQAAHTLNTQAFADSLAAFETARTLIASDGCEKSIDQALANAEHALVLAQDSLPTNLATVQMPGQLAPGRYALGSTTSLRGLNFNASPQTLYATALTAGQNGDTLVRTYSLPEGKLEAITELMIRDDVPVLVRPVEGGIEVHAPLQHQQIFEAFTKMVGSADEWQTFRMSEGKLGALYNLMERNDVPIYVRGGNDGRVDVQGSELERGVFQAFVNMIEGNSQPIAGTASSQAGPRTLEHVRSAYERSAEQSEREAAEMERAMLSLKSQHQAILNSAHEMFAQAEMIEDQANAIEDEAESILEHAEVLAEEAEETDNENAQHLRGQAKDLQKKAKALLKKARQLEEKAAEMERKAEEREEAAEQAENEMERLSDKFESWFEENENHQEIR